MRMLKEWVKIIDFYFFYINIGGSISITDNSQGYINNSNFTVNLNNILYFS